MNRIILIGNGFDKACGLKTNYEEFILWYFQSIFEGKLKSQESNASVFYQDLLLVISRVTQAASIAKDIEKLSTIEELQDFNLINIQGFSKGSVSPQVPKVKFRSAFFQNLIKQKTWGEIESEYFKALYRIKVKVFDSRRPFDFEDERKKELQKLNNEFEFIKSTFSKYIKEINTSREDNTDIKQLSSFIHKCISDFKREAINAIISNTNRPFDDLNTEAKLYNQEGILKNVVFINFNYTSNLIKQLFAQIGDSHTPFKIQEIRIHGNIEEDDERGIIFGYGDDTASEYRELEQDGNNEYLKFMKSTQYFHDDKYKQIISYINEDRFELFVAGHSLSLSDRVLLKTIVENENCRLIRFFHKGKYEDYRTLVGSMTRHFDDKIKMRDKFLPYNRLDTIL